MIITITGTTFGQPPYDIYLCDSENTCLIVSATTTIPPSIVVDVDDYFPSSSRKLIYLKIVGSNDCEKTKEYCYCQPVLLEFFNVYVDGKYNNITDLDNLLAKGVVVGQCCDFCPTCGFYSFGGTLISTEFLDGIRNGENLLENCCINYFLNEESYLTLEELFDSSNQTLYPYDSNTDGEYLAYTSCDNGFDTCIDLLKNKVGPTNTTILLDIGIIEYGKLSDPPTLCLILNYLEEIGITKPNDYFNILYEILNYGISVYCLYNDIISIGNIDITLKLLEAIGVAGGDVPIA
jgi:hypothetical protein